MHISATADLGEDLLGNGVGLGAQQSKDMLKPTVYGAL